MRAVKEVRVERKKLAFYNCPGFAKGQAHVLVLTERQWSGDAPDFFRCPEHNTLLSLSHTRTI